MRVYTRTMINLGVMRRRRRDGFPGGVEFELTSAGRALLDVGSVLRDWLQTSPDGPVPLGGAAAKSAIKALAESWRTNIIRALTTQSVSLTELNRAIPMISYPSLERRLTAMRRAHLVEQQRRGGRRTAYRATRWLHRAIVPIAAAIAWERRYVPDKTPPVSRLDVETAFLLAVPLMKLPAGVSGRCRLVVQMQAGRQAVSVVICIEEGRVLSCSSRLEGEVEAWVSGSPIAWLRRISGDEHGELDIGGDVPLATMINDALSAIIDSPVGNSAVGDAPSW